MVRESVRFLMVTAGVGAIMLTALPTSANAQVDDARIRKVEAEVRALQRKVFPGGDGRFFETPPATSTTTPPPPATTPVTDMLARVDAVEAQLAQLTAQIETNTNAVARLNAFIGQLHPEFLQAPASVAPPPTLTAPVAPGPVAVPVSASVVTPPAVATPAPTAIPAPVPAAAPVAAPKPAAVVTPAPKPVAGPVAKPAGPSAARIAAVQAIAKPTTGDAGDDEYSYGYRLWEAKFYPEAQQQLRMMIEKYPSHSRISYARNLLGRAYLDDGKPAEAAPWFLKNYQADKAGARAGDSLLYLAKSMIAAKDTSRACIALAEFGETYPALAAGRLQDEYESERRKVTCK